MVPAEPYIADLAGLGLEIDANVVISAT